MMGRVVIVALLAAALAAGAGLWWTQVHAFYREVPAGSVELTTPEGLREPIAFTDFRGIDSDSSPIRYRACFRTPQALADLALRYAPYERPEPRVAPWWFDCFDADEVGAALEAGEGAAFLSVPDVRYGIDRVVAILPDGRGFAWHQFNACGEVVFDGDPPPAGCPPAPEA